MEMPATYQDLLTITASLQTGKPPDRKLSEREVTALVFHASILSDGSDEEKQVAYDIVTRLLEIEGCVSSGLVRAARTILGRLGNFPGIALIDERHGTADNYSWWLGFEEKIRRAENSVRLGPKESVTLNDFQRDYIDKFEGVRALSVSGPTSVGKSFVLGLLVAKTAAVPGATIVYLVPTRALIRQVSRDLRRRFESAQLKNTLITTVPRFVETEEAGATVYVLTQERFHSLLYSTEDSVSFDLIVVDEATEIGSRGRGILLERSIQSALQKVGTTKVIFSSALCGNPEFLNNLFALTENSAILSGKISPVSQNLFFLSQTPLKTKHIKIAARFGNMESPLGTYDLPFKFRGSGRLPAAALHFTHPSDSSIVYANRPSDAETYAKKMADVIKQDFSEDEDISALCEYLSRFIHKDYVLVRCLKKGIGFHYGSMPDIVREEVENLFSKRKLKFICSTSTLLQGVNLPAKNIFLFNPKKGLGKPISSHDFWNLVGRAGRLGKEFHGNIWCIDKEGWQEDPIPGPREVQLRDAFSVEIEESGNELIKVLSNPSDIMERDIGIEQTINRVISEFFFENKTLSETLVHTIKSTQLLAQIDSLREATLSQLSLPKEIFKKNPTYSPWRLEYLRRQLLVGDISEFVPLKPYIQGAYGRFESVMSILGKTLVPMAGQSHTFYSWLGFQWMLGKPIGFLIENLISRKKVQGKKVESEKQVSSIIREVIENIDTMIRFKFVSGFKAYSDVLAHCLDERGMSELKQQIPSIHIYLEFGTADPTALALISIGLSRSTTLELIKTGLFSGVVEEVEVFNRLKTLKLDQIQIPTICRRELSRLLN